MATVYVNYSVTVLNTLPPGASIGDTIIFNGFNTGIQKYYVLGGTSPTNPPAWYPDYIELSITQVTTTRPAIFGTPQNSQTIQTNAGPQTLPIWDVNSNFPSVIPSPPDLTVKVKSFALEADAKTLDFDFTIKNSGTQAASDTWTGIYLSDDAIIDKSDTLLIYNNFGSLNGKHSNQIYSQPGFQIILDNPIPSGKHYIGVIVDHKGTVTESNEGNNSSNAILITSKVPAPDLKISLTSASPTSVASNGSLALKYTMSNAGTAEADEQQIALYLSKDATIDKNDSKWFTFDTIALSPGESFDRDEEFPLLDIYPAGKYYVGFIIDNDDRIKESNETNNISKAIPITITGKNLDPIATDDVAATAYRTPVKIDILANDSDPNPGDKLSFVVDEFPAKFGTVKINSDKTITYTPDENFLGIASFTYTLSDNHGGHSKAEVAVGVDWDNPVVNKGVLRPSGKAYQWDFDIPTEAINGTYTFTFEITKPTTLQGFVDCGPNVFAELVAGLQNKAPTLGPGPDRIERTDAGFRNSANQQIIDDPLMPGKYSLVMTRDPPTVSGFSISPRVSLVLSADEAGNRIEWATPIGIGATTKGVVNVIDNKDIYKFTLTQQSSVLVSLAVDGVPIKLDGVPPIHYEIMTKAGSADYFHTLESHIDAASRWVDTSYNAADLDDPNNTPLAPGDYYVIIYHPANITEPPQDLQPYKYSLWVNSWVDNAANRMLVEDFGAEGPKSARIGDLTGKSYKNHDFLGLADRNDFYVFTLEERSTVTIKLTQTSTDVSMNLDLSGLPDVGDPNAVIDGVREGAGPRTLIVTLDPGMYSLRAYTDTDFRDPAGTSMYGTALTLPKKGGAFYDLSITAKTPAVAATLGSATSDDWLGGNGDDLFNSGSGNDILRGWAGNDKLNGGMGNDIIEGGAGPDMLAGGGGTDTLSYARDTAGVNVTLGVGAAGMVAAAGGAGAKVQMIATEGGDAEDDQATGFANVTGGSGNDTLTGDTGNNVLEGGKGADTLTGGGGFDIVSYASSTGAVTINLANNSASGGDAQNDTISGFGGVYGGFGNDLLTGNASDNTLVGNGGDDILSGGIGNDTLDGGAGNDKIEGGAGNDKLDGGPGIDTLSYANSPAGLNNTGVVIDLSKKTATGNDAAGDKISNFENITGSAGNDTLTGDKSSNVIMGGAGNDTITGGAGVDTLTGGAGDDVFRFLAPADGGDDITDFNSSGIDKVSIVKSAFGMAAANLANFTSSQYFEQGVGHAPTAKHAQFLFDTATDELWFDSDGIGTKAAVLIATFTDGATLDASDFELK